MPLLLLREQKDAVELQGYSNVPVGHESLKRRSLLLKSAQADLFLVDHSLRNKGCLGHDLFLDGVWLLRVLELDLSPHAM